MPALTPHMATTTQGKRGRLSETCRRARSPTQECTLRRDRWVPRPAASGERSRAGLRRAAAGDHGAHQLVHSTAGSATKVASAVATAARVAGRESKIAPTHSSTFVPANGGRDALANPGTDAT